MKDEIRRHILAAGFDVAGFAKPQIGEYQQRRLLELVQQRQYGTMSWLAQRIESRINPQILWPEVKSVVAVGLNYAPPPEYRRRDILARPARISLYAANADYHQVLKQRLKSIGAWMSATYGANCRAFVDTGPVMEKALASAAGIGAQGKNTLLISPQFGPWLFLGVLLTDLDLAADAPISDLCGECGLCLKACPTAALFAPYQLNPEKCLAYLTIEYPQVIPPPFRQLLGNRIYGCDSCLLACPHGVAVQPGREAAFQPKPELLQVDPAWLLRLDQTTFKQTFANSPIKRIGLPKLISNVLIALGNRNSPADRRLIEPFCRHNNDMLRESAAWAMAQSGE